MIKRCFFVVWLSVLSISVSAQTPTVPVVTFDQLQPMFATQGDTTLVVNFWATWCRPCVAELPYFETLRTNYADSAVKVLLVSLDFLKNKDSQLIPFLQRKQIQSDVVLLNAPDANSWIDKISPQWSGAIPATLIIKGSKRAFYEQEFTYSELESIVQLNRKKP